MPEATQTAYRSSTPDIQGKIRRVVEVWRQRAVFEVPIQEAIEARLEELDKAKGSGGRKTLMGNSLFGGSSSSGGGSSLLKELEVLTPLQIAVNKTSLSTMTTTSTADAEYEKLNDPKAILPSLPLNAAHLSGLMKTLATAESSVAESIKARKDLIEGLEKILESNRDALARDTASLSEISTRRTETEAKKREVEDAIVKDMSAENSPANNNGDGDHRARSESTIEPERPDYEALTPPVVDAITPVRSPTLNLEQQPVSQPITEPEPDVQHILATMSGTVRARPASGSHGTNGMPAKRRKMSHHEEFAVDLGGIDGGMGDLDEDVAELLRQESAKAV